MRSRSPSTPSEGEIVESDSEKATTSLPSVNGTSVDRRSRIRVSVSKSPEPVDSPPRRYESRTRSRSPYREPRGEKRRFEDDYHNDRGRSDPRRFKVHYEETLPSNRDRSRVSYTDLDRRKSSDLSLRYDDRDTASRYREKRQKTRSRSPPRPSRRQDHNVRYGREDREGNRSRYGPKDRDYKGSRDSNSRLLSNQSVSDRGHNPIAAQSSKRDAETRHIQSKESVRTSELDQQADKYLDDAGVAGSKAGDPNLSTDAQPVDEATLIEERRKRREAIKAKYRGSATPLLVQALQLGNESGPSSPRAETSGTTTARRSESPKASPPSTPKEGSGLESPTAFEVTNDKELANGNVNAEQKTAEDEASAADYDPTMDMQEDKMREDRRHQGEELSSGAYNETNLTSQVVLLPDTAEEPKSKKPRDEFDMFAEEDDDDDMFAPQSDGAEGSKKESMSKAVPLPQPKALDMDMLDNWDDPEGYYIVRLGELIDGRYHVQSNLGRGMFSGVVRAMDSVTKKLVAIKIIRSNDTMKKAGMKEIEILQKLAQADPEDKKHMIRLERYFEHKGHLCMVFENLSINLREVLKKFGRDVGINLRAVRAYAQQMFLGLSLLRKCNILHADLKPDNVLVNDSRNLLKICDLGSASDASDNEITPYLVSRFYRAPEIILGMPYDFAIDTWSIGCTLFELYTGKILFTGRTNNQMLRSIMECRGKFSHKILRKAQFAGLHFDDLLNFRSVEKDKLTGKDVVRILSFTKPTRDLKTRLVSNTKGMNDVDMKELNLFIDLLDRCLNLNPEKRCTPAEALKHPFILRMKA